MSTSPAILIVDDQPQRLLALEATLASLQVAVVKARNPDAALAATLSHDFALAILDVQQPKLDGFELARRLRRDERTRRIPILFLTNASGAEHEVFASREGGVGDYLVRPCLPTVLLARARVLLELDALHRARAEPSEQLEQLIAHRTAELRSARERLEHLISSSGTVTYACRASGDFGVTYVSANVGAVLGYPPQTFTDEPGFWAKHLHPDDAPRVLAELPRLREGGVSLHVYRFRHADGDHRWIRDELRLIRDAEGLPLEWVGTWMDVTEGKRVELELEESEARYRRITDSLSDCRYTVRVEHGRAVETRLSPSCEAVTGYSEEEFRGDPGLWLRMVVEEDRREVIAQSRGLFSEDVVTPIEHRIVRKDGAIQWVRAALIPTRDASGVLVAYDGVLRNITEPERAEQRLAAANRELIFQNEEKERRAAELVVANEELLFENNEK